MATLPGTACRWPGCPEIVKDPSGYCEEHRRPARRQYDKQTDARRGSARQRGYDSKWEKFRNWFLSQPGNQICHRCLELRGEIVKAKVVHHIELVHERPDLRLHPENCMPVCFQCHEEIHGRR